MKCRDCGSSNIQEDVDEAPRKGGRATPVTPVYSVALGTWLCPICGERLPNSELCSCPGVIAITGDPKC